MKRFLQNWTMALVMAVSVGGAFGTVTFPQPVQAACGDERFLTMPAWYRGLTDGVKTDKQMLTADCNIVSPDPNDPGKFIWTIVLNVIEMMLHLVAYLTVGFLIFGGFKYMTSAGSADGMSKAKTTIANAIIGLVLSIVSIAIVNLVAGAIK